MRTQTYRVTAREKWHDFAFSEITDFTLEPSHSVSSSEILNNPNVSLYSLDIESQRAVFTITPHTIDLEHSAFMFRGQYENATHVITVSFEDFHQLASRIKFTENRLTLVNSVGRCGSTLVSKAFQALERVRSLSEPDALTLIVNWRTSKALPELELERLTRSCIAFCCKPLNGKKSCTHWAIKFRSQCTEICDLMAKAFPCAKYIYLTREPLDWLDSAYRAFVQHELVDDHDYKLMMEDLFAKTLPLVQSFRTPGNPMPVSKVWLLNWISNMETQKMLKTTGITFCEADFSEIKSDPKKAISRLLQHSELSIDDWGSMKEILSQDSQAGSSLNQKTINKPERLLPDKDRREARRLLDERGFL